MNNNNNQETAGQIVEAMFSGNFNEEILSKIENGFKDDLRGVREITSFLSDGGISSSEIRDDIKKINGIVKNTKVKKSNLPFGIGTLINKKNATAIIDNFKSSEHLMNETLEMLDRNCQTIDSHLIMSRKHGNELKTIGTTMDNKIDLVRTVIQKLKDDDRRHDIVGFDERLYGLESKLRNKSEQRLIISSSLVQLEDRHKIAKDISMNARDIQEIAPIILATTLSATKGLRELREVQDNIDATRDGLYGMVINNIKEQKELTKDASKFSTSSKRFEELNSELGGLIDNIEMREKELKSKTVEISSQSEKMREMVNKIEAKKVSIEPKEQKEEEVDIFNMNFDTNEKV